MDAVKSTFELFEVPDDIDTTLTHYQCGGVLVLVWINDMMQVTIHRYQCKRCYQSITIKDSGQ